MLLYEWEQFRVVLYLLMTIIPKTFVIYSINFLVLQFLGAVFLLHPSVKCLENKPVLMPSFM